MHRWVFDCCSQEYRFGQHHAPQKLVWFHYVTIASLCLRQVCRSWRMRSSNSLVSGWRVEGVEGKKFGGKRGPSDLLYWCSPENTCFYLPLWTVAFIFGCPSLIGTIDPRSIYSTPTVTTGVLDQVYFVVIWDTTTLILIFPTASPDFYSIPLTSRIEQFPRMSGNPVQRRIIFFNINWVWTEIVRDLNPGVVLEGQWFNEISPHLVQETSAEVDNCTILVFSVRSKSQFWRCCPSLCKMSFNFRDIWNAFMRVISSANSSNRWMIRSTEWFVTLPRIAWSIWFLQWMMRSLLLVQLQQPLTMLLMANVTTRLGPFLGPFSFSPAIAVILPVGAQFLKDFGGSKFTRCFQFLFPHGFGSNIIKNPRIAKLIPTVWSFATCGWARSVCGRPGFIWAIWSLRSSIC